MMMNIQFCKAAVFFCVLMPMVFFACDDSVKTSDAPLFTKEKALKKAGNMSDDSLAKYIFAGAIDEKGYKDGTLLEARFNTPRTFTRDSKGNIYVADTGNNVIRKISPEGQVTTWAGTKGSTGAQNGHRLNEATFDMPASLRIDAKGVMYVADMGSHKIRKIVGDTVSTLLGSDMGYVDMKVGGDSSLVKFEKPFKFELKYFKDKNMFPNKGDHDKDHKKYGDHIDLSLRDGPHAKRWRVIVLKDDVVKEVRTIRTDMDIVDKYAFDAEIAKDISMADKGMFSRSGIYVLMPDKHAIIEFGFNKKK